MSTFKTIYGTVEFKNPLTICEIAIIYDLTDEKFDVGETQIEFEDAQFDISDFVDWLATKEIIEGDIRDYGDYEKACIYCKKTRKWRIYGNEFVCDITDKDLINELESRGYKVEKVRQVQ